MSINRARVHRTKLAVAGVLGHHCGNCGAPGLWPWELEEWGGKSPPGMCVLQVGHVAGRDWSIRRLSRDSKWSRYLEEALSGGIVRAECGPCNRQHGGSLRYDTVDRTRQGARRRAA